MPNLAGQTFLRYWLPVILWMIVIAIESTLLSSARTGSFIDPILHAIMPWFSMRQIEAIHHVLRKVGHFVGYGLMGYFLFRALRGTYHVRRGTEALLRKRQVAPAAPAPSLFSHFWRSTWALWAIFGTFLVATADELHQMTDPSRTGSWWDVLLDTTGASVILLLVLTVNRVRSSGGASTVSSG